MKGNWLQGILKTARFLFGFLASDTLRRNILQAIPFWIASLITGLLAVGYTMLFGYAEDLFDWVMEWRSWSIFLLTPLCFVLGFLIVRRFAINARGSGIPQVIAAIDLATPAQESKISRLLSIRIIIVKIISSLLMALGGGAIGREGPTIQIASSVFRSINNIIPKSWPKLSKQSYILTGAAAGLAAAFNTPLGGVVFAMEELARTHIRFFRTALFSAVIIAGLTAQGILGPYLYLGYPDVRDLKFLIFFGVAAAAVIAGLLASLMCKLILAIVQWKKTFSASKSFAFAFAAGLFMASVAFFLNNEILGSGHELMSHMLFTTDKHTHWHTVLLRTVGPIVSFNAGAAGGVFAPALAAGASIGGFISSLFDLTGSHANILILSGMVGFLTGVTRTPFTSAILVLEMTDRHSVIFHILLAALVSYLVAYLVMRRSFYEQLKFEFMQNSSSQNGSG